MRSLGYRDLTLEAFVHATESQEKVERAMRLFAPHAKVERRQLGGHFGQSLSVLRAVVEDDAAIARALSQVKDAVGAEVARTASRRLDRDLALHIRFDKQAAARGEIRLEQSAAPDVVKLEVRLRGPRRDRDEALVLLRQAFSPGGPSEEE